jgi:UDP-N-acetylmuramoyl-L-alanyl-D-glutamate--2,6-diaminopimelate ligase
MSGVKKLARKVIPKDAVTSAERQYRLVKAKTAYTIYGSAPKNAKVIAVTGTNGKTTTCAFINAMLKGAGLKTAVYTTAFVEIDGNYQPNTSHMTVASPWSVQKFFKQAKAAKVDWVILEVTSHALDQYRIYGIPVEVAVFTNLTQDHLDYHKTMDNYAAAKARLITDYKPKHTVLNADDDWFEYFGRKVKKNLDKRWQAQGDAPN